MQLRQAVDLTQEELAAQLGVTVQTVSNWENGRATPRLTIPQFKTLCRLLKKDPDELPDSFGPSDDR